MAKATNPPWRNLDPAELDRLLERLAPLVAPADFKRLQQLLSTLRYLMELLPRKNLSLRRLRQIIFGAKTEKIQGRLNPSPEGDPASPNHKDAEGNGKKPPRGHGRNGADRFPGAQQVEVPHPQLKPGDRCPDCGQGTLYDTRRPAVQIRILATPMFPASIYRLLRLRCHRCQSVFTAPAPPQAGHAKYSPEVPAMLALLRYGSGMPLYRIAKLQRHFGVPLPVATQWDLLAQAAQPLLPLWDCLLTTAARSWLFGHDDTRMKILGFQDPLPGAEVPPPKPRKGIFTTGILAQGDSPPIALYFTGHRHAGENLQDLLDQRPEGLPPPIQMCDGASVNPLKATPTRQANCCAHSRRKFVELLEAFPQPCHFALERFRQIYAHEAQAKAQQLDPQARLAFHQAHSTGPMQELHRWAQAQLDQRQVEPNSALGQALTYLLKRWEKLTLFLREPGAPLDNNLCEQLLKRAILHRKNSLFYKTDKGARVGDLYMSLIHTCELCGVDSFAYLSALQTHASRVEENPQAWLPWNYTIALATA